MNSTRAERNVCSCDPVAAAIEEHLHEMEAHGDGRLVVDQLIYGVRLTFGSAKVWAENYDIALVRLAGVLLDDEHIGGQFMARLRSANIAHLG